MPENTTETPTRELKNNLAILRFDVNNLKDKRDRFIGSTEMDANVKRIRTEVQMEEVQEQVNDINQILLNRSKQL